MRFIFGVFSVFTILGTNAEATLFRSSYVSFELPAKWDCKLEQTEHVCHASSAPGKQEAVIVLTAKEKGPSDSLSAYEAHLKAPRIIPDESGKAIQSKIIHVKKYLLNGHEWVDGFHENSEVFNYYTRYLATVKDHLGILVTFSAHKKNYSRYSQDFAKAITSLRVLSVASSMAAPPPPIPTAGGGGGGTLGSGLTGISEPEPIEAEPQTEGGSGTTFMALVLLILAIVGYLMLKKNKKRR